MASSSQLAQAGVGVGIGIDVYDLRPMVREVVADLRRGVSRAEIAARFHRTLADIVVAGARRARTRRRLETVALSGGCFQNRILTKSVKDALEANGFEVLIHRRVPPNDGGVSLGQAAVAAGRWIERQNGGSRCA